MNEDSNSTKPNGRNWLRRLYHALMGEPNDRDELIEVLRDATDRSLLNEQSLAMMEGILQFSVMPVRDIMVPRSQMAVVNIDASIDDIMPIYIETAHSRYPVVGESRDEVIGIMLAKDLLPFIYQKTEQNFDVADIMRPAVRIPESKRLDKLLQDFRRNRNHMAIVVDEYGGVSGLVTIEDILEQIVGEIEDEYDTDEDDFIRKHSENTYILKALTPIEEFNDYFNTQFDNSDFDTIGGIVTHEMGHIPKRGEKVSLSETYHFKVLHSDKRRVHLLRLEVQKKHKRSESTQSQDAA